MENRSLKTGLSLFGIIGGTLLFLAQMVLIGMKLTGAITFSWWLVMMPALIFSGFMVIAVIVYIVLIAIAIAYGEEEMRDMN